MNYDYFIPVRILFGAGRLCEIGQHAADYGEKALIVTTGTFFVESGLIKRIKDYLEESGVDSEVCHQISPNPHLSEVEDGIRFAKEKGCDVIIGLGGGSGIDAAKAIAAGLAVDEPIWPYWIGEKVLETSLPVISVTTTSGTGSHVTMFSVITHDETQEKPGLGAECIYPKVAIVDPELMLTLPSRITAATGFDVLAHSIEAYTSSNSTPITDRLCEDAIRIVGRSLPEAVENGENLEARSAMAQADTCAGLSITTAMITLCHAMSHVVCGIGNLVHGESLAAMTPAAMRLSMNDKPEKYKKIGWLLSGKDFAPQGWTPEDSVRTVEAFIKKIGLDISLTEQGIEESDYDRIVEETLGYMAGACELDPHEVSPEDVMNVLMQSV